MSDMKSLNVSDIPEMSSIIRSTAGSGEYVNYAQKRSLSRQGGLIYGQFNPSFGGACQWNPIGSIEAASVLKIEDVGSCETGEPVVRVTHM